MHVSPTAASRFESGVVKSAGLAAIAAAALVCPLHVIAQERPGDEESSSWGLGFGAVTKQLPYRGFDRENKALPLIQFENKYVKVFGPGVEVKLPGMQISEAQRLNFSLVGQFDLSGYKASDSVYLAGMAERKGGFWIGGKAEWATSVADVTAEWTGDASGNSKGQKFSLGIERSWQLGQNVMLTPRLVANWHDAKYVDYYYGVRAGEARAGRAAYRGDSAISTELGVRGLYRFDKQHAMFVDVGVTSLGSKIKDSPLVDRSSESKVFVGYMYRFR